MVQPIGKIITNLTMSPQDMSYSHCLPTTRISRKHTQSSGPCGLDRKWIAQWGKLSLQHQNRMKHRLENVPGHRFFGRRTQMHMLYRHRTSCHVMLTVYFSMKIFRLVMAVEMMMSSQINTRLTGSTGN